MKADCGSDGGTDGGGVRAEKESPSLPPGPATGAD